ncbi:MAG: DUF3772 domain-containing protein [Yoonia sp.]|nr:DUF3772 domain-containing protein [Yoonia sp.]
MSLRGLTLILWLALCGGQVAVAQTLPQTAVVDEAPQTDFVPETFGIPGIDLAAWEGFAIRAENIVEPGTASRFALNRLRAELVPWREQFFAAQSVNAARLATVSRQIASLTPAQEAEVTDLTIAARLDVLTATQTRLARPALLAQEAYVRADGLIGEIDSQSRSQETKRLLTRGVSPANPVYWTEALATLTLGIGSAVQEVLANTKVFTDDGRLWSRLAVVIGAIVAATFFVFRTRSILGALGKRELGATRRRKVIYKFLISVARVVLPVTGLALLSEILRRSGFFGLTGMALVAVLPTAGSLVFYTKWLADQYFPRNAADDGILGYDFPTRVTGRRFGVLLGWTLAISVLVDAFLSTTRATAVTSDVVNLPFQLGVGWFLWQLGRDIVHNAAPLSGAFFKRNRIRKFIGHSAQIFAVIGPLASLLGFGAAAQAITVPAVVSLAIVATIVVLQLLSFDVMSRATDPQDGDDAPKMTDGTGLLPVVVNGVVVCLTLPIFALIWGATVADLLEVWTRFLAGFSVGETRISPTSFLTFVSVFAVGYLLTGVIRTSLKTSVLPRTQLDLGGQNAIEAGVSYIGVFLSALIAFSVAGIDLSSLAIVAGALSVGIGFGLQNIVSNFVSGIILLIERPVGEGDMIEVGGQMGYVRDISVRSTRIETFDRIDVIIPNADLVSGQVANWTRGNLVGRATVPVGVAYGSDTVRVAAILQEIAESNPIVVMNPPPSVLLTGFGADSIDFEIRAIIRDVNFINVAKTEMFQEIIRRFAQEGIEIPFAQRDVWLRNPEVLHPKGERS